MAIKGLTHDADGVMLDKVVKYRGKISTGWGPKEGPNKNNYPVAAGKFIFMKEEAVNKRIGDKTISTNKWVENKAVQSELVKLAGKNPMAINTVCLVKHPNELWESYLAMYDGSGLVCRGNGPGTEAKFLTFDDAGDRKWETKPCTYTECPDHISGACKARGVMKVYPDVDATPPNPYKITTSSIGSIKNIESSLDDIWNLILAARAVKEMEAGHSLEFDGMFGLRLQILLRKRKSGGNDVYIMEIVTSKKFRDNIMAIINRQIDRKASVAALEGDSTQSLLEAATSVMIEDQSIEVAEVEEVDEGAALENAAEALTTEDD